MDSKNIVSIGANVSCANIAGTVFIYREDTKAISSLNEVGSLVWSLINGSRTINDIASICAAQYSLPPEAIRDEIATFLEVLSNDGVASLSHGPCKDNTNDE